MSGRGFPESFIYRRSTENSTSYDPHRFHWQQIEAYYILRVVCDYEEATYLAGVLQISVIALATILDWRTSCIWYDVVSWAPDILSAELRCPLR